MRRHSTSPVAVSRSMAQARGSPSRGWPDAARVEDAAPFVEAQPGAVAGRQHLDPAAVVAEGQREVRVADQAVGRLEGGQVAARHRARR